MVHQHQQQARRRTPCRQWESAFAVIEPGAFYPEGALWYRNRLYYAEMTRERIVVRNGAKSATFWRRAGCGPTSIAGLPGGFVVACHDERAVARVSAEGRTVSIIARASSIVAA